MADYELSNEAENDVVDIGRFTINRWGLAQADDYIVGLHDTLGLLADSPRLGRSIDDLREGYRRHEYKSHSIFYQLQSDGIRVIRILHQRMDPERHL
ncbi:MAG: type II toxin-antitoxin system RelE/ParE family toxin [Geminicoccaceae bacterium]